MVYMRQWAWVLLLGVPAAAAVELRIEPGRERIRPHETAIVLLGPTLASASVRVVEPGGGWVSKPFRQPDGERAVLYSAPGKPGKYTIEAPSGSLKLEVEIEVSPSAPSRRPAESVSFGPESEPRDFYRDLAEYYAPLVCQETWFDAKADYLARFDYDGNWRGDDNWDNLPRGSSQAYVYYSAAETATHFFLLYNFFHPRRYSDQCGADACHENDNGGLILTVRKDGSRYGRLEVMETLVQNNIYSYTAEARIRDGAQRIRGAVPLWRGSHPIVFIESGAHGVFSAGDREFSRFSIERMEFTASTGVTYRFGGGAARPAHANDRDVSYELLSIADHWWVRSVARENRTFDEYFRYGPFGGRPGTVAEEIAGSFVGRKHAANRAKPFWGWHDTLTLTRRLLAIGQWGLDPAYAVSVNLRFPPGVPFSLDYIYNPYLEGGGRRDSITLLPPPRNLGGNGAASAGPGRQPLSAPAEKPRYNLRNREGQLEFRARVDGGLYLYVRGDLIEVEYLSGRPIDEIRYRFSQPLPAEEMEDVRLEDVDGRGAVRLLEWPNAGNQYTAKIRIHDDKGGASSYRFKLVWKR